MADVAYIHNRMSPDEYLAAEEAAEYKSEFVDGVVYGMAGGTPRHNSISLSLSFVLLPAIKRPCRLYMADVKVRLKKAEKSIFYYPDVWVTCTPPVPGNTFADNPVFICEVLSPSTARTDRLEKFENYKLIDSLQEFMLVEQDVAKVALFRRSTGWAQEIFTAGEVLHLESLDFDLAISDLYARVDE